MLKSVCRRANTTIAKPFVNTSAKPYSSVNTLAQPYPSVTTPSTKRHVFENEAQVDIQDYEGISSEPFAKSAQEVLNTPTDPKDIECKPDGILYLPEIKYRRILLKAFGAGGWY